VRVAGYIEVFENLEAGNVDAGVTNRLFGLTYHEKYNLRESNIIFNPVQIKYALTKDNDINAVLIEGLDQNLKTLKANPESIYHEAMDVHIFGKSESGTDWKWVQNIILTVTGTAVLVVLFVGTQNLLMRREISIRKETEAELKASKQKLETQTKEVEAQRAATLNLLEDMDNAKSELKKAYTKLRVESNKRKAVEESRQTLITLVTHDLKQPLTPVMGYAREIREKARSPKCKNKQCEKYADIVVKNSQKMLDMINRILNLFKLEAGQLAMHFVEVDVAAIVKEAIGEKDAVLKMKKIKITTNLNAAAAEVDHERLKEVFTNLIDNGIKFTKNKMDFKTWTKGGYVYVSVKDNGIGIKKEDLGKLFKKFHQTSEGKAAGGTGIGLTMIQQIIKAHNGKIDVRSTYGKGAEFVITLPKKHKKSKK